MPDKLPSTEPATPTPEPKPAGARKLSLSIPGVMPDAPGVESADLLVDALTATDLNEPAVKFPEAGETSEELPKPPPQPPAEGSPGPEAPAGEGIEPVAGEPDVIEGTPDEIAQKYRSLQGQFKDLNGQITDQRSELDAANQFFASLRRDGVIDESGNIVARKTPETGPPAEPETPKEFSIVDVVNYDYLTDKLSEAISGGDKKSADEMIASLLVSVEKYVKKSREQDRKGLDEELQGYRDTQLQMKVLQRASALFNEVGKTYDSKAKEYVYPELRDPQKAEQILEIWQTFHPEHAMSPRGVYDAWLEYKHRSGHLSGKVAPPPSEKVDVGGAKNLLENKQKARKTSAEAIFRSGGTPPVTPHSGPASEDQVTAMFMRKVRESAKPIGSLGFTP